MKYLFVPYSIALLAKQKGFDEPCCMVYHSKKFVAIASGISSTFPIPTINNKMLGSKTVAAPLYQQITDWFRENHTMLVFADTIYDFSCHFPTLHKKSEPHIRVDGQVEFKKYYDALDKAIIEAFKLLN